MKKTLSVIVAIVLITGVSAVAWADGTSFMITGQGTSENQQFSSDALQQADDQAKDNATSECINVLNNQPGDARNVHVYYHATWKQRDGLFGAVANATGTCYISSSGTRR